MRELGIARICPVPEGIRCRNELQVYPYLLCGLSIMPPDQACGSDLTYIRMSRA